MLPTGTMNFKLFRTLVLGLSSCLFLVGCGSTGHANLSWRLQVEPVEWERVNAPVTAEIPLPSEAETPPAWSAHLTGADATPRTAQVEAQNDDNGTRVVLLHWVEPSIGKGESPRFFLTLTPAEETSEADDLFRFVEAEDYQDLFYGERPVSRLVTIYDPNRHADTHKPYHHVYDFKGNGFITKGPGGLFPHHKGIYLGWNQTRLLDGETHDFWHARSAYQEHREFLSDRQLTGPVLARSSSVTDWKTPDGTAVVQDTREVTTWKLAEDAILLDYLITIQPLAGDIYLGGDAHHAGFQFRASQEVAENRDETVIITPNQVKRESDGIWSNAPWMALSFDVGGNPYTVLHLDHVKNNPSPTVYSTRDYARFGAFFTSPVLDGDPLVLKYRILVKGFRGDDTVTSEALDAHHADYLNPVSVRVVPR